MYIHSTEYIPFNVLFITETAFDSSRASTIYVCFFLRIRRNSLQLPICSSGTTNNSNSLICLIGQLPGITSGSISGSVPGLSTGEGCGCRVGWGDGDGSVCGSVVGEGCVAGSAANKFVSINAPNLPFLFQLDNKILDQYL
jgi:hypothetical protein